MLTPEQVTVFFYIVGALAGLALFYFVIKGAVKSGTSDILDELKKRTKERETAD
jgi:hypothetical protein